MHDNSSEKTKSTSVDKHVPARQALKKKDRTESGRTRNGEDGNSRLLLKEHHGRKQRRMSQKVTIVAICHVGIL